jgi:hypothetical protein
VESLEKILTAAFGIGFGILLLLAALAWIAMYWATHFRGDRTGSVFVHAQGEGVRFPGRARVVVKRRDLGSRPDVTLRFGSLNKIVTLEPAEARALAEALERAVAVVRREP